MTTPRLSLCIATFNRAAFIGQTLESVVPQLSDAVELVIYDASTDDTEQVVRAFAARSPHVRYERAAKNGGVDQDFDLAVQRARGEYCWLMTDDDLLRDDAVATVLAALAERDWSLVIVNAEVRDASMREVIERSRLPFEGRRVYGPEAQSRLLADVGAYASFIGCVVIKRALWLERERAGYYGSLFIHVGVLFQAPLPGEALVLTEPLVQIRYGNALWRPRDFEIWMFKWPELIWSLAGVDASAREAVYPREPWRDLKRLFFFRAKGTYSLEDFHRWIAPRVRSRRERLGAQVVAAFPGPVANALALLYLRVSRRETGRWLADTKASRFHPSNWREAWRSKRR